MAFGSLTIWDRRVKKINYKRKKCRYCGAVNTVVSRIGLKLVHKNVTCFESAYEGCSNCSSCSSCPNCSSSSDCFLPSGTEFKQTSFGFSSFGVWAPEYHGIIPFDRIIPQDFPTITSMSEIQSTSQHVVHSRRFGSVTARSSFLDGETSPQEAQISPE